MSLFGRKQKIVEKLLLEYFERVESCLTSFSECVGAAIKQEPAAIIEEHSAKIHQAESMADNTRREIEMLMYGKSLFPESRGDILGLLEAADSVPNAAESVCRRLIYQKLVIPPELGTDIRRLVDESVNCGMEMLRAFRILFEDYNSALHVADRVNDLESRADEAEYTLLEKIFQSDRDLAEKILFRDFISRIGDMADRAENASDRIRIVAAKRRI